MILAADFNTNNLHQNLIIELFRRIQINLCHTLAHIHAAESGFVNEIVFRELGHQTVDIAQTADILHRVTDRILVAAAQPVILSQYHHPAWEIHIHLMNRELIEHFTQHTGNIVLSHVGRTECHDRNVIFGGQLAAELLRFFAARPGGVNHKHKWLANLLQLSNYALFGIHI
ncbi:hypothetical protein D3C76_333850 [compost metagenome]